MKTGFLTVFAVALMVGAGFVAYNADHAKADATLTSDLPALTIISERDGSATYYLTQGPCGDLPETLIVADRPEPGTVAAGIKHAPGATAKS